MIQESLNHHVFLSPRKTAADADTEGGAPITIVEMLAAGIPAVSTMHCDIPEVMGPVLRGPLVPPGDCAGLARHLLAVAG